MSAQDVYPATMDPRDFARVVKKTSNDELRQIMQDERRTVILRRIFGDMPGVFRADRAGPLDAVIHWHVGDRPGGGVDSYELVIADGTCVLSAAPEREPRLSLTLGAVDFIRLVTGNANPMMLFMRGRMKAKGDLGLATRFPNLFEIPRP